MGDRRLRFENVPEAANRYSRFNLDGVTDSIPANALAWLKKYGITDEEIRDYGISFDRRTDSLSFPLGDSGTYSTRYFGRDEKASKSRTYGPREHGHYYYTNQADTSTGIFVEDCISAIKVARHYPACPVLGSTVPPGTLRKAQERFQRVGIWLDRNMAVKATRTALAASTKDRPVRAIVTPKDPKDYSNDEIRQTIDLCFA